MRPALLIMAAGMGSRYGGIKQIDAVGVNGETLLDFGVYDSRLNGFGKAVFIIRKDIEKDFRERLFDRIARNMDAEYVFQSSDMLLTEEEKALSKDRTKPWGTIHAVLCAEKAINTPFAVVNADDYYGRSAYASMGSYLSKLKNDDPTHAMVGFKLENTMSPSGAVTRAICISDEHDKLISMEENYRILYKEGQIVSEKDSGDVVLTGGELVSMNFFGFTPKAFESFNEYWDDFKTGNIRDMKKECVLPNGVSYMVERGQGSVSVLSSSDRWFGMTYPEDKPTVMSELRKKIEYGYYPEKLWEK